MKHLMICLTLGFATSALSAQTPTLTPEVIATAGETFSNGALTLEWTLGELATETFAGTIVLTQGIHQPAVKITSNDHLADNLGTITVYPNPTTRSISIERERNGALAAILLDMNGRTVLQQQVTTTSSNLDLSHLPPGIYVLRLSDGQQGTQSIRIKKL